MSDPRERFLIRYAGGFAPFLVSRAEGAWVETDNGRVLDFTSGHADDPAVLDLQAARRRLGLALAGRRRTHIAAGTASQRARRRAQILKLVRDRHAGSVNARHAS